MNINAWLLGTVCTMMWIASLQSQTHSSVKAKNGMVTTLDGTKLFGFIEIMDDYTIRITNDSGITRLPIVQLGDLNFKEYGFQKERAKDGRFWYERKEAIRSSEKSVKSRSDATSGKESHVETLLAEIAEFQPLITSYEKTIASKNGEESAGISISAQKAGTSDVPFRPLFSQPGLGGPLPQPFSVSGLKVANRDFSN